MVLIRVHPRDRFGHVFAFERAVEAGTDDYLSKPINKIALLKRVETMLKYKQTTDELERLRAYIREMEDDDKRAK